MSILAAKEKIDLCVKKKGLINYFKVTGECYCCTFVLQRMYSSVIWTIETKLWPSRKAPPKKNKKNATPPVAGARRGGVRPGAEDVHGGARGVGDCAGAGAASGRRRHRAGADGAEAQVPGEVVGAGGGGGGGDGGRGDTAHGHGGGEGGEGEETEADTTAAAATTAAASSPPSSSASASSFSERGCTPTADHFN